MKSVFTKIFSMSLLISWPTSYIFAQDCKPLSFVAEDYAYLLDFDGSIEKTCKAAEKSATWKACVACAGDDERNQQCHFKQVSSVINDEKHLCSARAEAVSQFCVGGPIGEKPLVHCGKLTGNFF